jgi:thiol reductant ABC exporter CydC subunit
VSELFRAVRLAGPVRGRLLLAAFLGTVAAGSAVGLLASSAWLISRAAERPPLLYLMVAIVAVRAFALCRGAARYAERLAAHDAVFRLLADLRVRVYVHLERLAPARLSHTRSGDLLSRLVADVDTMQDLWLRLLLPYVCAGVVGAGSVALVAGLLPAAGVTLAASLLLVALLAPVATHRFARREEARVAPLQGQLSDVALDLLRGAPELVACGAVDRRLAEVTRVDAELVRASARSAAGVGLGSLLATLGAGAAAWAALALGVPAVRSGALPSVVLAVVVLTPLAVHDVCSGLAAAAQQLPRVRAATGRVLAVLDEPAPVVEPTPPAGLPAGPYGLRFTDVTAGWPGRPDVLTGASFSVAAGERVALVGASGAGKSTLAALLVKFLPTRGGRVELVGADGIRQFGELDGDDVRRAVGLCAQDTYLFDTTIAENVRLARPGASDDQIREALGRAHLLDWVDGLPAGLATRVGEHGARVSAGQRQRIALARTLLAGFPVIVLDEPTEHLDEPTAAALMADLLAQTADRTLLLLTHRQAELHAFDRVLRLDGGTLAEHHSISRSAAGLR